MNFIKVKRWSMLLLILVLTLLTASCTPNVGQDSSTTSADISDGEESEVDGDETVTFQATILEIGDVYYLVEPVEGSAELNSADQIKIPITNMNPSPEPEIGDVLEIKYDGWIAETYPAHLDNIYSISVIHSFGQYSWQIYF